MTRIAHAYQRFARLVGPGSVWGMGRVLFALVGTGLVAGCSGSQSSRPVELAPVVLVQGPSSHPLPDPTPPPSCVQGALVDAQRVCGLGVAGRAFYWDDENMRDLARRRAAENLAGMLRSVVSSALVLEQNQDSYWSRQEVYLEIDPNLVDRIQNSADIDIWFDVLGEGPFSEPQRTYACACMSTVEAGMRIDAEQARRHALARQYSVDEVPRWLKDTSVQNESLRCAAGYHPTMFHAEEMLGPLTEKVRAQLMKNSKTWVLTQLDERTICEGTSTASSECHSRVESVLEAANEGVSRGVALTALWFDPNGIGPNRQRKSAYGWGCVFDALVLQAARQRLEEIKALRRPIGQITP